MDIKTVGVKEGFEFLADIEDDFQKALADGKISKEEALQLFSIVLRHAVRFGLAVLAMEAQQTD